MYINKLNATNTNFKDSDLQITLRERKESTRRSFRNNFHMTEDIRTTYVKNLWYYSTSTIFKISNKYRKFSRDDLMMSTIMKTFWKIFQKKFTFFLDSTMSGCYLEQRNWKCKMIDILKVSCSVCIYRNLLH